MKTTPLYPFHKQLGAVFAKKHLDWNLPTEFSGMLSEHAAVRSDVGIADVSYRCRYRLTGNDRATFLQRIVSNDVEGLSSGQGIYALLLTHRGKIIADLSISVLADSISVDTAPETAGSLFNELDKYIIADDVELADVTMETGAIGVHGPKAPALLGTVLEMEGLAGLPERSHLCRDADTRFKHAIICVRTDSTGECGYTVYTAAETLPALWEALMAEGKGFGVQPVGWNALEALRIEAGIPRYGTELTDSVIPLEAELEHAINFEKGCYIGQEIVARMKYRGHPNRLLRGIELDVDWPPERCEEFFFGTKVFSGEKEVGWVTSAAFAPTLKKSVALGYVRTAVTEAGSRVELETPDGRIPGRVVRLPFFSGLAETAG